MRKNICSLILILCIMPIAFYGQANVSKEITIVSWNIQMLPNFFRAFSPDLRKMQAKRLPWIVEYVKSQDFDVICFQEVFDLEQKRRLRRKLKKLYPYHVNPINKGRITSNGIMLLSKYPMKRLGYVVYAKGSGSDGMAAKGCVLAELNVDGKVFQLAGTHLQAGGGIAQTNRNQQYKDIRVLLDKFKKENIPQIVAGDMNTRNTDKETYERMITELDVQDFPLNEDEPYTVDGKNSWNNEEKKGVQIDYIFLRDNGSKTTIIEQKIIRPKKRKNGKIIDLADHYGVRTIIRL